VPDAPDEDGQEILGSLPRRRPSIESPRRASARASAERAAEAAPSQAPPEAEHSGLRDLEHLALGGARLAAGAAATGLKLAGRTVGGLGRVVGRR
jgi:hypothetical protein